MCSPAPDFFEVTKAFHNALHGDPISLGRAFDLFLATTEQNAGAFILIATLP